MITLLTSVLVPIVTDFLKSSGPAISRKVFGESVEDQIKIANADVERLKALAALDTPGGTPSTWVIDLRASFRYIAAGVMILGGLTLIGVSAFVAMDVALKATLAALGMDLAAAPFGFIFGERLVLSRRTVGK